MTSSKIKIEFWQAFNLNSTTTKPDQNEPRPHFDFSACKTCSLHIVGDSKMVIDWLNGQAKHTDGFNSDFFMNELTAMEEKWRNGVIKPRSKTSEFDSHMK